MNPVSLRRVAGWSVITFLSLLLAVLLIVACIFIFGAVSRYQARANAHNQTITAQKQVRIATLHAQARFNESIGIKKAQREINRTLTPQYIAFELTQAMQAIATSGKNNSVIYIPTNPKTGLPIVPTTNNIQP